MTTLKNRVGRPSKDDSKKVNIGTLDIAIKVTEIGKDMYGNILYWDGSGTFENPVTGRDETFPKGRRAPVFQIVSDDLDKVFVLNVIDWLYRAEKKAAQK
jgi:hypothetical protein